MSAERLDRTVFENPPDLMVVWITDVEPTTSIERDAQQRPPSITEWIRAEPSSPTR